MSKTKDIEPFYRLLGARFRLLRVKAGKTHEQVGEALGLSRASICNIEYAHQRILAHQIPQLAESIGISVPELMTFQSELEMAEAEWKEAVASCAPGKVPSFNQGLLRP